MYTGLTGALKVYLDGNWGTVAYISGWSIDDSAEIIETTKIGEVHKDAFAGMQNWSASADGAIVFNGNDAQAALFMAKQAGLKIKLQFFLDDKSNVTNGKSTYFSGYGYIESLSVSLSAEDKGNISIGIKGTGKLKLRVNGRVCKVEDQQFFTEREVDAEALIEQLSTHTGDTVKHITGAERTAWNESSEAFNTHKNDAVKHVTATERSNWNGNVTSFSTHSNDGTKHITSTERGNWNAKANASNTITINGNTQQLGNNPNFSIATGGGGFGGGDFPYPIGRGGGIAIGPNSVAGHHCVAVGEDVTADGGKNAGTFGSSAQAFGANTRSDGYNTTARGNDSDSSPGGLAMGYNAYATDTRTIAYGNNAMANGFGAMAVGNDCESGAHGVAVGQGCNAEGDGIAFGKGSNAAGGAMAAGNGCYSGPNGVAVGQYCTAYDDGIAFGKYSTANGNTVAIGNGAQTSLNGDIVLQADNNRVSLRREVWANEDIPANTAESTVREIWPALQARHAAGHYVLYNQCSDNAADGTAAPFTITGVADNALIRYLELFVADTNNSGSPYYGTTFYKAYLENSQVSAGITQIDNLLGSTCEAQSSYKFGTGVTLVVT
ncbi:MAG: hypothetical protein FWD58_03100 [Firmicutes bacterium]|nr:hypothetical protein [Bacillota bacterium]